jgi:hypothetical protein
MASFGAVFVFSLASPREEKAGVRRRKYFQIKSPYSIPLPVWAGRGSRKKVRDWQFCPRVLN